MTNVLASVAFREQNWVITHAALAATDAKPTIANQKWILLLTGDPIINFGALSSGSPYLSKSSWRDYTLSSVRRWCEAAMKVL